MKHASQLFLGSTVLDLLTDPDVGDVHPQLIAGHAQRPPGVLAHQVRELPEDLDHPVPLVQRVLVGERERVDEPLVLLVDLADLPTRCCAQSPAAGLDGGEEFPRAARAMHSGIASSSSFLLA